MTDVLSEQLIHDTYKTAKADVIRLVEKGRKEGAPFSCVVNDIHSRLREICNVDARGISESEIKIILVVTKGQIIRLLADLENGYYSPIPFDEQDTNPIMLNISGGSEDSGISPVY